MEEIITYKNYEEYRNTVNRVLNKTVENFILTGYLLKQGRDTDILKESGYANVNEFAEAEYHLDASQVSRYIRINDKFAVGGYSPELKEEYQGYGYAKLALMLTLPEEITEELSPNFSKSDIQEVKEEIEEEAKVTDIEVLLEGEKEKQKELNNLQKGIHQLFEDEPKLFKELYMKLQQSRTVETIQELLAPNGEKTYSVQIQGIGRVMILLRDPKDRITVFKVRGNEKEFYAWEDVKQYLDSLLSEKSAEERWEELYERKFPEEKEEIAPVQPKKQKTRKESKVKKAKVPEKPKPEPKKKVEEEEKEIPGQMEITRDLPEYCPDEPEKEAPAEVIPEKVEENTVEEPETEVAPAQKSPEILNAPENPAEVKAGYGSRKQYIDELTAYGAALYMAASIKDMRNLTFQKLTEAGYWEKWLETEVDENGEEIEVVEEQR